MIRRLAVASAFLITAIAAASIGGTAQAAPGDLDKTFGKNGLVTVKPDAPRDTVMRDFLKAPDGRMLAVGGSGKVSQSGVLVRYLPDGELDRTFGANGVVLTPGSLWARAVIQPDGKIVTFGRIGHEPAIARFDASGQVDTTFADNGTYVADQIRPLFDEPFETLEFIGPGIDSKGRIIATLNPNDCHRAEGTCLNMPLLRFTAGGEPDPTFGDAGMRLIRIGRNANYRPQLVALAPDDSIMVRSVPQHRVNYGGYVSDDYPGVLQRFGPDGKLDRTFGTDGRVLYGHSESDEGKILFEADGGIIVIHDGVLRVDHSGSPDPGYGSEGFVRTGTVSSGKVLADGSMLLASVSNGERRLGVSIRLRPSGQMDPNYSNDGMRVGGIGQAMTQDQIDSRRGINFAGSIVDEGGRIIVAATGRHGKQFSFDLIRLSGKRTSQRLFCKGKPATIYGSAGSDRLDSGIDDVVASLGGDDRLSGGGLICAGSGDDRISMSEDGTTFAGSGNDWISGSDGTVYGGGGNDRIRDEDGTVYGGRGNDHMEASGGLAKGGPGDDLLIANYARASGGPGDDRITAADSPGGKSYLRGESGDDLIRGSKQPDLIDGGSGRDRLAGDDGADRILGRAGVDVLMGGEGSDLLIGGPGRDKLDGGPAGARFQIYSVRNRKARGKVKIIGNRVKATNLQVWMRCSGYTNRPVKSGFDYAWMFDELNFKPSGRFREDVNYYDGFGQNVDGWMKGRRTSNAISVSYNVEDDFSYGEDGSYQCHTGKSNKMGYGSSPVRFKLKRRSDQTQVLIQGGR